ncbi:MAG: patatin-like phospholipase family protein [Sphingobacteriales bacterium]|nr:patatin-like phospholipase family protein [Sphingobacteriales bacterium]MBI3717396.1 patatin-like phospholipase family protein [Sphingobacteriales bacterium]
MKEFFIGLYRSLPVQLVLLHFRRYQVLLLFWLIVVGAVSGNFMKNFGVDSLFLAPEYLGKVNWISTAITGIATGVFFMSWNITTFIMFSRHFRFLATTSKPFLKYCINNAVIPAVYLIFYFVCAIQYEHYKEDLSVGEIISLTGGFLAGLILLLLISFAYFFSADRTIIRQMAPIMNDPKQLLEKEGHHRWSPGVFHVEWYLSGRLRLRKTRDVSHYSRTFLESVFKRHHFSAIISILMAFLFLLGLGFFMDNKAFQAPAAASILIFFSILIAAVGSLSYWLGSWAFPFVIVLIIVFNFLFRYDIIDPRNRAFGLNYDNKTERPGYNRDALLQLSSAQNMEKDKQQMLQVLENWKKKQGVKKPVMYILNFSGGGNRSACFAMNVLQHLDSVTHGELMKRTFLMTGASGGMLGATYFRELYLRNIQGAKYDLQDDALPDNISKDLLNPLFSSFISRDLIAPAEKFNVGPYRYVKDRAYAFEQQLNDNAGGILDRQLKDYEPLERNAIIPLMIFNSTVTLDGRKMMTSTQPIRFLMRTQPDTASGVYGEPDAIDFCLFFQKQNPYNLRLLTAMRTNASFPYVLPSVWLPTKPVIDVMDAGLRDNYGQETTLRFLDVFKDWLNVNTSGVVQIQVRDRKSGEWQNDFGDPGILQAITKPATILQYNWHKLSDYYQEELTAYAGNSFQFPFQRVVFAYIPEQQEKTAALNFHLTNIEKKDIAEAMHSPVNQQALQIIHNMQIVTNPAPPVKKAE